MQISRYGIVERPNHLSHISGAVAHGDTVYLQGVTPDPGGDITSQTRQVLERIDALLAKASTDKSKLLTALCGSPTCGSSSLTMPCGMRG
jgi:enamine deaminase RidA (YjgF/YER057c/UK114 family)